MPFEEIPHTADLCLRVWAADLPTLFTEAALAMNKLAGISLAGTPSVYRQFSTRAPEPEGLLVAFLSELLYTADQEKVGFDQFKIKLSDGKLHAGMNGSPIRSLERTIKAVTYHNMKIQHTPDGCRVEIVFDV